jgi:hypothetical protein
MKALRRIGVLATVGGMMLAMGNVGWSQQGTGSGMGGQQGSGMGGMDPTQSSGGGRRGSTSAPVAHPNAPVIGNITPDMEPTTQQTMDDQARLRNMDRQRKLVADTEKLVALANELKSDVDKSSKNTLSLDVIKKADEIEKLARSVKDKMKGS